MVSAIRLLIRASGQTPDVSRHKFEQQTTTRTTYCHYNETAIIVIRIIITILRHGNDPARCGWGYKR